LEPWQEDRLELEPFRSVVGEQMDAARALAAGVEAPPQLVGELRARERSIVCGFRQLDEPCKVGLARQLALAELVGKLLEPAGLARECKHSLGNTGRAVAIEQSKHPPCRIPREQRRALEGQARVVKHLLEVGQSGVRTTEDGGLLARHPGAHETLDLCRNPRILGLCCRERPEHRRWAGRSRRP
jgi:hypothetical protein